MQERFRRKAGYSCLYEPNFLHKSPVRQTFWSQSCWLNYYVYATFTGSVCGGIVNCIINYKWTFKSKECKKRHVIVKYLLVWIGSILLNTWGIYFMTETISRNPWVQETLKHYIDDLFVFSKIVVSLLVGFLWNYNMQRIFVYKNCRIRDRFQKANLK